MRGRGVCDAMNDDTLLADGAAAINALIAAASVLNRLSGDVG
jgi:hypothetical protein